jgi:HEAT repeat protein
MPAAAQPIPSVGVREFQQALKTPYIDPADAPKGTTRKEVLQEAAKKLRTAGDLRQVLADQGWRDDDSDPAVSEGDLVVRRELIRRLKDILRKAIQADGPTRLAAVQLLGDIAGTVRGIDPASRNDLAGEFARDLVEVVRNGDAAARPMALRALGRVVPPFDYKEAWDVLREQMRSDDPAMRAAAVEALAGLTKPFRPEGASTSGKTRTSPFTDEDRVALARLVVPLAGAELGTDADPARAERAVEALLPVATWLEESTSRRRRDPDRPAAVSSGDPSLFEPAVKAMIGEREAFARAMTSLPTPQGRARAARVLEGAARARTQLLGREDAIPAPPGATPSPKPTTDDIPPPPPKTTPGLGKPSDDQKPKPGASAARRVPPVALVLLQADVPEKIDAPKTPPVNPILAVLPALAAMAHDPDPSVRLAGVQAISAFGRDAEPATPVLVEALMDRSLFVRWASAWALRKLAPRNAETVVPALASVLCDPDTDFREAVLAALERFDGKAVPAAGVIAEQVVRGDPRVRQAAVRVLRTIRPPAEVILPAYRRALRAPEAEVRLAVLLAIEELGPQAAPILDDVLAVARTDSEAEVRRAAADAVLAIRP